MILRGAVKFNFTDSRYDTKLEVCTVFFRPIEYIVNIYMARMKSSALYLFLVLLAVLVISVFLGYRQSSKAENFASDNVVISNNPSNVATTTYPLYSTASLYVLNTDTTTNSQMLYDSMYGNLIVAPSSASSSSSNTSFTVISRNGSQQTYTSSNGSAATRTGGTLANDLQNMNTITTAVQNGTSDYAWTYGNLPVYSLGVLYATWKYRTFIYILDANVGTLTAAYLITVQNGETRINRDTSLAGTPLPTKTSTETAPSSQTQEVKIPGGGSASAVSNNKAFSFAKGLLIANSRGEYDTYSTLTPGGNFTAYDNTTNTLTIVSKPSVNAALVSVVTYNDNNTTVPYNLFITARLQNTRGQTTEPVSGGQVLDPIAMPISTEHMPPFFGNGGEGTWNNPYILKTEIVPPVCPMCPGSSCASGSQPSPSPSCPLSVNSNGDIVDCNGNVIMPAPTPSPAPTAPAPAQAPAPAPAPASASSPTTFGQGLTSAYDTTVSTAGNLAGQTVGTAGGVVNNTVSTAGNVATSALGDVTGLLGGLGKDVTGAVTGVAGDVTGIANTTVNDATGLAAGTVGTAAGLIGGAGSEVAYLANNAAAQSQYGPGYPYGYPYGPAYVQGYPYAGQGYGQGYGQGMMMPYGPGYQGSCAAQSSNFMPITNDFSQFGR